MIKHAALWQVFRFGLVGLTAAAVNFLLVVFLVETFSWNPLLANTIAFILAFNVSYLGHRFWTFNHKVHRHNSVAKFFFVAAVGLILNESLFAMFLHFTTLLYAYSLLITILIVAVITFLLSKLWAFK